MPAQNHHVSQNGMTVDAMEWVHFRLHGQFIQVRLKTVCKDFANPLKQLLETLIFKVIKSTKHCSF